MTLKSNIQPSKDDAALRKRVLYSFRKSVRKQNEEQQLSLPICTKLVEEPGGKERKESVSSFIDFISGAVSDGDVYLFGGVLRDLALTGNRGFNSDIDIVVDGDWAELIPYIESKGASKNKFGGYRLEVDNWPFDIWRAKDTWAIRQGLVKYRGVNSLTSTTILNWDAILMNWRTRKFVYRKGYFQELRSRSLDIVLEDNPNPLGMAVRVFRNILLRDAKRISPDAVRFLANSAKTYSFEQLKESEFRSYGNCFIQSRVYSFFKNANTSSEEYVECNNMGSPAFTKHQRELDSVRRFS